MKRKIFSISIVALVILGAVIVYKYYSENNLKEKSAAAQLNYFSGFEARKNKEKAIRSGCENVLVISKDTPEEYAQWLIQDYNSTCIIPATGCSFPAITDCSDVVKYNLDLYFVNHTKDFKKQALAGWLYDNASKGKICLKACYATIENAHKADLLLGDLLDDVAVEATMKYKDIVNVVGQSDYDNDKYDNYIHFYFDSSGQFHKEKSSVFDESGGYFSVQLFHSIVDRRKNTADATDDIGDDTVFEFRKAKMGSNQDRVVFSIKNGNGSDFYDFSQIPPNKAKIYLYAFSPL